MSNAQTFEQSLTHLEQVVARLESGELPLDQALADYEVGIRLVRECRAQLSTAELRVRRLVESASQTPEFTVLDGPQLFGSAT